LMLSFEGKSLTQNHEILSRKVLLASHDKDLVILAFTVLIGLQSVTDRRTDRKTDRLTIAKTYEALHVARKNAKYARKIIITFFSV